MCNRICPPYQFVVTGVLRFVVSGCEVSLIVYSKRGDPTYHPVDLTKSKTGLKKETVVLKNIANYLIYLVRKFCLLNQILCFSLRFEFFSITLLSHCIGFI